MNKSIAIKESLVLLFLLVSANLFAQNWSVFTKENSKIPENVIKTLAVDKSGNLWLVTGDCFYGGNVVKYNGKDFLVYDSADSDLNDRFVTDIAFDVEGNVWLGSRYKGVWKFDGKSWQNFTTLNSTIPDNHVKKIISDSATGIWICTDKGLAQFTNDEWKTYNKSNSALPSNNVNSIAFEKGSKAFWVATDKGLLYCYSIATLLQISNVAALIYNTTNSVLPDDMIHQVIIDNSRNIWISSWGGIVKYNNNSWNLFTPKNSILPDFAEYILSVNSNVLWVSTNMGLYSYDGETWKSYTPANSVISDYFVNKVALGINNEIWIATQNGLIKLTP